MKAIQTVPELYAHAIAIEREAAERYAEFAERMSDLGNEAVASVFRWLAGVERGHLQALLPRGTGVELPGSATRQYQWLDAGAPETAARELVFRLLTPRKALEIALGAEKRAQAFFERVLATAADPVLRTLAREMGLEELEHVRLIERMLETTPSPEVDWSAFLEPSDAKTKGARNV